MPKLTKRELGLLQLLTADRLKKLDAHLLKIQKDSKWQGKEIASMRAYVVMQLALNEAKEIEKRRT